MNGQKHIISRQILEISVPDRDRAQSIQNRSANVVKYKLLPELERMFENLSGPDEILRIDQLTLDLGDIAFEYFEEEMLSRTLQAMEVKLTEILQQKKAGDNQKSEGTTAESDEQAATLVSRPDSHLRQLTYYLKFGVLPWWQNTSEQTGLFFLLQKSVEVSRKRTAEQVLPLLAFEQVRDRIVYQLDEKQFSYLLDILTGEHAEKADRFYKLLTTRATPLPTGIKHQLQRQLLEVTSKDPGWEAQVLFREFFLPFINEVFVSKTHKEQQRILPLLVNILESKAISRKMSDRLLNYLITIALKNKLETREVISERFQALMEKALLKQQKPKDTKQEAKGLADGEEELVEEEKGTETLSHQKKELEKNEIDKPGEKVLEELEKELEAIEEETTEKTKKPWQEDKEKQRFRLFNEELECYVSNAGLVLLHPFLPYLFDGLGLLDKKKKFKSEEGAFRATHLLQYLATGESATPEHELSLNKILCGLDLNEPVPYEVELSVNEKEECDNLLKVVLERWEVLKTTNIEALREGFLNRDGRLAFKGNGWNLFIERTTLDVMMDRLPWSISIIKIPWREDLIYVEW